MRTLMTTIALGTITIASVSTAQAEDVKSLIKRHAETGVKTVLVPESVPYSYTVNVNASGGEGDEVETFTAQYRVNPQAEFGNRVTLLSGDMAAFPEDFQKDIKRLETETTPKQIADEFWCEDNDDPTFKDDPKMADSLTVLREDETEAVIELGPESLKDMMQMNSGDGDDNMPKKILKRLMAEVTVSKPDLNMRQMKVWLTKPTTIKIVAKIKEMKIEQSCDIAPNGIPYVTERKMRVSGKALGKAFMEDVVVTISDLQPL